MEGVQDLNSFCSRVFALTTIGFVLTVGVSASNYEFSFQAAKAAALGGAFVAQADDPSAIFYNLGAMALLEDKPEVTAGISAWSNGQSIFQGLSPGSAAGFNGKQSTQETPMPHAYYVKGLGTRMKLGAGIYSPFYVFTDWANTNTFPGRDIALSTELNTFDANLSAAVRVTDNIGFGAGIIYRASDFSLLRREQAVNPLTGQLVDIANFSIETPFDTGYGWNAGAVYRFLERYSVGATYRSGIEINYSGTGTLTQIETGDELFDRLVALAQPFDQELGMGTRVEFPSQIAFGAAVDVLRHIKVEIDFNETAWSSIQELVLYFPNNPLLTDTVQTRFVDTSTIRGGLRIRRKSGAEYRAGLVVSESPVPDETIGPLFPDSDSTSISFGYGKDWLDLAFVWTEYAGRTSSRTVNSFNGNYASNGWVLSISVSK
jgi:long-chain fatty acid transport protein